jgi:hypothetical protein
MGNQTKGKNSSNLLVGFVLFLFFYNTLEVYPGVSD